MASTKSTTTVLNNLSLSAAGGPTTSSSASTATGFGASIFLKLTNGATAPTTEATLRIEVSGDGTNFFDLSGGAEDLNGGTTNAAITSKHFELPVGIQSVRVIATHGDDQAVVARADVSDVTAVA
jgi:hypothetical protein